MGEARRRLMMNGNVMPIRAGQQQQFDVREAVKKSCEKCGFDYFEKVYKIGMIPVVAPSNKTGREVRINYEIFICLKCGHEFGAPVSAAN